MRILNCGGGDVMRICNVISNIYTGGNVRIRTYGFALKTKLPLSYISILCVPTVQIRTVKKKKGGTNFMKIVKTSQFKIVKNRI